MSREREICALLGKPVVVEILSYIADKDAATAGETAEGIGIHVATAVKYLSALYELDILDREVRKTGRRPAYLYRLKSTRIQITFNFSGGGRKERWDFLYSLFKSVRQLYGSVLPEKMEIIKYLELGKESGFREFERSGCEGQEMEKAEAYLMDFARRNFGAMTADLLVRKAKNG